MLEKMAMFVANKHWLLAPEEAEEAGGSAGGEGAEPSAAGSESEGARDEAPESSGDFDWGALADEGADDVSPPSAERAPEAPAEEPAEGEEPVSEEPAELEPEAVEKAAEEPAEEPPQEPQAEAEKEEETPPSPPEPSREEVEQQLMDYYGLDDATVREIQANPEETLPKVLPKLAARLHLTIQEQMAEGLKQHLPSLMENVLQSKEQGQKAVSSFYDRWPKLKGKDEQLLSRLAQAYRQAHPDAKAEEVIEDVGAMAMVKLKIPFDEGGQEKAPAPEQKPAQPPRPAPQGASRPSGRPPAPENPFETIAEQIIQEENG